MIYLTYIITSFYKRKTRYEIRKFKKLHTSCIKQKEKLPYNFCGLFHQRNYLKLIAHVYVKKIRQFHVYCNGIRSVGINHTILTVFEKMIIPGMQSQKIQGFYFLKFATQSDERM